MRVAVLVLPLFGLTGCTAMTPTPRLTLAEAQRTPVHALAVQLLGAVGASLHFVEAKVHGNGGGMIFMPGLNGIDLYRAPHSAGFEGLCQVDAVNVAFEPSAHDVRGDPPHAVRDFYTFTRFALYGPNVEPVDDAGWKQLDRDCARLTPVADRKDPLFFAVWHESGNPGAEAYFAMRAVARAQSGAPAMRASIVCTPDRANPDPSFCADPALTVARIPIRQIHLVDVGRCPDTPRRYCVRAVYAVRQTQGEGQEIELNIVTDAEQYDPPKDFAVVSIAVAASTWME